MSKAFASQADLEDKKITFEQLSPHCWAYTAEGDPNSGVIIGDDFIMVSDATATPAMARDLIKKIRTVSDKPIKYVLLTHYHAVRVLGASAYFAEGATEIIASQGTLELIRERGAQDMKSEMERFPRLFRGADSVPGLTWPTLVIGGARSGKSAFAEGLVTASARPRRYIATAEPHDDEMRDRIARHRSDRGTAWTNAQSSGDAATPPDAAASAPQRQAPPSGVRLVIELPEGTLTRDVLVRAASA